MTMSNSFQDLADDDFEDFSPKPQTSAKEHSSIEKPTAAKLKSVGQEEGFVIDNNPLQRKTLRSGRKGATEGAVGMSVRFRVSDWNKFAEFCRQNDYTVAEGFGKLVEPL